MTAPAVDLDALEQAVLEQLPGAYARLNRIAMVPGAPADRLVEYEVQAGERTLWALAQNVGPVTSATVWGDRKSCAAAYTRIKAYGREPVTEPVFTTPGFPDA